MIPRYARPEMTAIWSPDTKYRIWFEIEAYAADRMAELGIIPKSAAQTIWEKGRNAKFSAERIDEIEREVKHDVIAFLTHLSELVGPEARFVHQGMTSSDVLDTCLSVQMTRACDILLSDMDRVLAALKARALEHKNTVCVGRSHGIHAFMQSPQHSASNWRAFMLSSNAANAALWLPVKRSRFAPYRALWAPSQMSTPL